LFFFSNSLLVKVPLSLIGNWIQCALAPSRRPQGQSKIEINLLSFANCLIGRILPFFFRDARLHFLRRGFSSQRNSVYLCSPSRTINFHLPHSYRSPSISRLILVTTSKPTLDQALVHPEPGTATELNYSSEDPSLFLENPVSPLPQCCVCEFCFRAFQTPPRERLEAVFV